MTRFGAPTFLLALMVGAYLGLTGAPVRVHVLSVACLLVAFWLPAVIAPDLSALRRRLIPCAGLVLAGMLLWDALSSVVIAKAEPFDILRHTPWAYVLVVVAVGILLLGSAALNSVVVARIAPASEGTNAR